MTVNERGAERTISMNSDAKIYVEDVTINSQLRGGLEDLRVGDALLVVLAKDGRVLELHDFFRSRAAPSRPFRRRRSSWAAASS